MRRLKEMWHDPVDHLLIYAAVLGFLSVILAVFAVAGVLMGYLNGWAVLFGAAGAALVTVCGRRRD